MVHKLKFPESPILPEPSENDEGDLLIPATTMFNTEGNLNLVLVKGEGDDEGKELVVQTFLLKLFSPVLAQMLEVEAKKALMDEEQGKAGKFDSNGGKVHPSSSRPAMQIYVENIDTFETLVQVYDFKYSFE